MPIHFFLQKFQTNHFYTCLVLFHKAFCIYERPMCANHKIAWLALALAISGSCSALEHCCSTPPPFYPLSESAPPIPPRLPLLSPFSPSHSTAFFLLPPPSSSTSCTASSYHSPRLEAATTLQQVQDWHFLRLWVTMQRMSLQLILAVRQAFVEGDKSSALMIPV